MPTLATARRLYLHFLTHGCWLVLVQCSRPSIYSVCPCLSQCHVHSILLLCAYASDSVTFNITLMHLVHLVLSGNGRGYMMKQMRPLQL